MLPQRADIDLGLPLVCLKVFICGRSAPSSERAIGPAGGRDFLSDRPYLTCRRGRYAKVSLRRSYISLIQQYSLCHFPILSYATAIHLSQAFSGHVRPCMTAASAEMLVQGPSQTLQELEHLRIGQFERSSAFESVPMRGLRRALVISSPLPTFVCIYMRNVRVPASRYALTTNRHVMQINAAVGQIQRPVSLLSHLRWDFQFSLRLTSVSTRQIPTEPFR